MSDQEPVTHSAAAEAATPARRPRAATPPPLVPRPAPLPSATSPRLAALKAELRAGRSDALAEFWRRVITEGTPLVERIGTRPDERVVTFLWRDRGGDRSVSLLANKLTDPSDPDQGAMTHMPGPDLWYRSFRLRADWRGTYQIAPDSGADALPAASDGALRERWRRLTANAVPDPFNLRTLPARRDGRPLSVVELPDAPAQPWCLPQRDVPAGDISEHRVHSAVLGNERRVWVYTPPAFTPTDRPLDLLVLLDGDIWGPTVPVSFTLDNLIAESRIPPVIALMPDSIDDEVRSRELGCHAPFVTFLTDELIPWAAAHWPITEDPARSVIAGQSLGGLTAAFVGLRAPGRFGNVLSQSGSFWWQFDDEAEWLTRRFALSPALPLRFYLDVGLQEWILLPLNRNLRDVLAAQGYDLTYAEYNGGHDYLCWRGSLVDGLLALSGAPPSEGSTAHVHD